MLRKRRFLSQSYQVFVFGSTLRCLLTNKKATCNVKTRNWPVLVGVNRFPYRIRIGTYDLYLVTSDMKNSII
jgi:hypothetical protein